MSDAKTRAEARRQAILGRGSSRLAKLTSSARGEDAVKIYDDPPLPTLSSREPSPFVPASRHATPAFASPPTTGDAALDIPFAAPLPAINDGSRVIVEDPTSTLPSIMGDPRAGISVPFLEPSIMSTGTPPNPTTLSQWVFTLVRMVSAALLVFSFIFWLEPRKYKSFNTHELPLAAWERWSELVQSSNDSADGIQHMPLQWTLVALQTTMYALQLVLDPHATRLPTFLSLVLPHLPKHIAAALHHGFAYIQIGSFLLDDLAFAIFIVGVVVWASSS